MSKRSKVLNLISLVSNALIILFVCGAFVWSFFQKAEGELLSKGITSLKYYTVLSNLLLGVSAIPMLIFSVQNAKKGEIKTPLWAIVLKFAAVVATTITFLTVVVVFIPLAIKEGHSWLSLFSETNLFNHLITPLVGLLGFCLCEICLYDLLREPHILQCVYGLCLREDLLVHLSVVFDLLRLAHPDAFFDELLHLVVAAHETERRVVS